MSGNNISHETVFHTPPRNTTKDGFNNAGALLADTNQFPGIDIARFGADINSILDRETHAGVSVLAQLDAALAMFDRYYVYERVEGFSRNRYERIPREAFREAVANALAHRTWDVNAQVSAATGFGKDKCLRLLGQLADKGLVRVQGAGRATRYVMN